MNIGIYGGSFNPVHIGHLIACVAIKSLGLVDRIEMVPCYDHACGKDLESYYHRFQMCRLATEDFDFIKVNPIESMLGGKSFTIRTLDTLQSDYFPKDKLHLVVGADVYDQMDTWDDGTGRQIKCKYRVIPVGRSGYKIRMNGISVDSLQIQDISSSDIRKIIKSYQAANDAVKYRDDDADLKRISNMLPVKVWDYIINNRLYGAREFL